MLEKAGEAATDSHGFKGSGEFTISKVDMETPKIKRRTGN